MGFVFGEVDTELPAAAVPGDADANAAVPAVAGRAQVWNGTEWERERGNQPEATLLTAANRTAAVVTPAQTNRNARGVFARLIVATLGTGTLQLRLRLIGSSTIYFTARSNSTNLFMVYPGLPEVFGDILLQRANLALPRQWDFQMVPSDASIWNYTLTVSPIV
jgi:hypothetical protein